VTNVTKLETTTPLSKPNDFTLSLYQNPHQNTSKFSRLPHRALGDFGESLAKRKFEQSGYVVRYTATASKCGDLSVKPKGLGYRSSRIEIKTAQCGKNGYRFCVSKGKHTNHCHSDFVLLIAIDKYDNEYLYLIPSFAIADITYITIKNPMLYKGMYAKYRVHRQLSLNNSQEIALF